MKKILKSRMTKNFNTGDIVIAAITSCTNTSNLSVMIAAGFGGKKSCRIWIKY